MLNALNTKILLIIVTILGLIAAGIAWRNRHTAALDTRMEEDRKEILRKYSAERTDQARKNQWADSVKNHRTK